MSTSIVLLFGLLLVSSSCLLTSSHFKKEGIDIKDPLLAMPKKLGGVATSCNVVSLNVAPYNYNGNYMLMQEL